MAKKVLKFERPAEFYFKTTQKMIDSGHYIGAVNMIRKALKKEPENEEYRLYYAELLTDMNKYEESNSILFEMLSESKEPNADCFFNLGRNFLGLNDFTRARDSFEKYMEIEPDNEFSEEMDDLFMLLEDDIESEEEFIADAMEKEYYRLAQEGKSALDSGEYEKAAEVLEKIKTD
ncbi:MAG: tetratricopeptide repeat protein, partial [Christensenellaceae bacterium]